MSWRVARVHDRLDTPDGVIILQDRGCAVLSPLAGVLIELMAAGLRDDDLVDELVRRCGAPPDVEPAAAVAALVQALADERIVEQADDD